MEQKGLASIHEADGKFSGYNRLDRHDDEE
jgi:hypothetical protein